MGALKDPSLPEKKPYRIPNTEHSHKGNHLNTRPSITQPPVNTLCRMPHLNNKQKKNTNQIISRQDYHLTQPCPSEEKQTNNNKKKKLSTNLTLYKAYTNAGPNLGRQKAKERKNSTLKPGKRKHQTQ